MEVLVALGAIIIGYVALRFFAEFILTPLIGILIPIAIGAFFGSLLDGGDGPMTIIGAIIGGLAGIYWGLFNR